MKETYLNLSAVLCLVLMTNFTQPTESKLCPPPFK